jgi:hypothetical protein
MLPSAAKSAKQFLALSNAAMMVRPGKTAIK